MRLIKLKYKMGVDLADPRMPAHFHQHQPNTFFWQRICHPRYAHATSNTYFLFDKWSGGLLDECKLGIGELITSAGSAAAGARAAERAEVALGAGGSEGGGGGEFIPIVSLTMEELGEFFTLPETLLAGTR